MPTPTLFSAVQQLAARTHTFSDSDLDQPYQWRAHGEGVRFALIGTYHELRELALQLAQERAGTGQPLTAAQRALAPYHAAYRDLQALLLGVDEESWARPPGADDWPLRVVVVHLLSAERTFFALVHHALAEQEARAAPPSSLPADTRAQLFDDEKSFNDLYENGTLDGVMEVYAGLHRRVLQTVIQIGDQALEAPSLWWEGELYPIRYRLLRFDAHLRQHTVQVEKVLAQLDQPPTEARRLLRLVYQALAEVESLLLGAGELAQTERQALATEIEARTVEVTQIVARARELADAVAAGEPEQVASILSAQPALANAVNAHGVPLVRDALYRGHPQIADTFVEGGAHLSIMEGAALGRQDVVEAAVAEWPGWVDEYSVDGFTPLQLACFFGHEEIARYLLTQGADVHAVARNSQQLQALHAAAAGPGAPSLVGLLLEHGADPNARQQQAFTALHTAGQQGDVETARLLLEHGADATLADAAGRTPADFARTQGHEALVTLLEEALATHQPAAEETG